MSIIVTFCWPLGDPTAWDIWEEENPPWFIVGARGRTAGRVFKALRASRSDSVVTLSSDSRKGHMTSSPSLRWLSWVAVVALFVGTSGKLDRKKLFDRMMRLKHVLEKPMMVVFDCKESRMTQDVLDRLESLRDRIKIYTAEESGNEIGSKLQINPEKCLSVAMFPK
eukprot:1356409-Amorphochlora_amoeboformis.AAC.2